MQEKLTFESEGLKLSAMLHIPDSYQPGTKLPAFIVCHGFVGSKDESHAQIQAEMMEEFGYAALRLDFRSCGESEGERG
jgi:predicted alpha/beta-fold hydrolase